MDLLLETATGLIHLKCREKSFGGVYEYEAYCAYFNLDEGSHTDKPPTCLLCAIRYDIRLMRF